MPPQPCGVPKERSRHPPPGDAGFVLFASVPKAAPRLCDRRPPFDAGQLACVALCESPASGPSPFGALGLLAFLAGLPCSGAGFGVLGYPDGYGFVQLVAHNLSVDSASRLGKHIRRSEYRADQGTT